MAGSGVSGLDWYDPRAVAKPPPPPATAPAPPTLAKESRATGAKQRPKPPSTPKTPEKVQQKQSEEATTPEASEAKDPEGTGKDNDVGSSGTKDAGSDAAVEGRDLNVLEVARSVDEATRAKEQLARDSIVRARDEVQARKAALQAQMREKELQLMEEERRLAGLEQELKTGCSLAEQKKVQDLRTAIESRGRAVRTLEREVSSKKDTMQRATDAYIEAEERLACAKHSMKKLEEEMLEIILSSGKEKDARLTDLLMKVPEVEKIDQG
ncbi:PPID [Symbiodinium natans]|uniref:PPID protein n=1 Tax=Symbiodinium natans TaxID=878477 RepID=A0A812RPB8_9DINO|nr:PPID [Symbiodinium natans]